MRDDEWDAWHTWAVNDYAGDLVRNEALEPGRALAQATEETDALLTDGLGTPGHHLFVAEDEATGRRVGHLWFGPRLRNPDPAVAWLYDIFVEEADRGRGIGRAMLDLFEPRRAPAVTVGSSSTSSATTPRPGTSTTRWGSWRWRGRWARTSTTSP
jgi:GNAT superfamily N-acetyltransferase